MTKIKAKVAKTTKSKKTKPAKTIKTNKAVKTKVQKTKKAEEELDNKNVKKTVEKIVESKRQVMYNYPEDVKEPLDRKSWRQKVRNTLRKFELDLSRATEGKDKTALKAEYVKYRKEVLLVP